MPNHHATHRHEPPRRHHRRYGLVLGILALGMLFWARLLIIADIPRTAIAEDPPSPESQESVVESSMPDGECRPTSDEAQDSLDF